MKELTAYEITYTNGQKTRTSMAAGVTLEQAEAYFIGKQFNLGVYQVEDIQTAIKIEKLV